MEKLATLFGSVVLFAGMILFIAPLSAAVGWTAGWTTSLFFNDLILGALSKLGLHGVSLPDLGATLGFAGAFLRTQTTVKK